MLGRYTSCRQLHDVRFHLLSMDQSRSTFLNQGRALWADIECGAQFIDPSRTQQSYHHDSLNWKGAN